MLAFVRNNECFAGRQINDPISRLESWKVSIVNFRMAEAEVERAGFAAPELTLNSSAPRIASSRIRHRRATSR